MTIPQCPVLLYSVPSDEDAVTQLMKIDTRLTTIREATVFLVKRFAMVFCLLEWR